MDCERCESLLIDHAHAELAPDAHADVTRHLAACPTCALASCRLRADLDGVLQAAAEAPRAALRLRLREEVARSFRPPWWRRGLALLARPVPAYAVAVALLLPAALWLARGRDATPSARREPPPRLHGYDAVAPLRPERPYL